jgi:Di- and tricarboxylate transporters
MSQQTATRKSEVNLPKCLISIIIAVSISFIPPPQGLTSDAMLYIGIFFAMIIALVINAGPDWVVTTFAALSLVALKLAPLSRAMANFAGSFFWTLLGAMGFASCVVKSGLMKRIAFNVLKFFPPSYTGQVLAIASVSIVMTPLIPSTSAKLGIIAPFTASVASETGMEPHSKGLKGLWFVMFTLTYVCAFTILTGGSPNFIMLGTIPAEEAVKFTWTYWFQACALWWLIVAAGTVLIAIFFFQPDKPINMSKDFIKSKIAELGPMSSDEKVAGIALAGAVILYTTESFHGLNATVVSWMAFFVVIARGMFSSKDVGKLPWGLLVFIASMLGVADHMGPSGVNDWLGETFAPIVIRYIPNSFVFVIVVIVVTWILRLGVDLFSIIPISMAIFGPVAAALGYSPWLVVWLAFINGQQWLLPHNQIQQVQSSGMMGNVIVHEDIKNMSWLYMLLGLGASLASVPVWTAMGLF